MKVLHIQENKIIDIKEGVVKQNHILQLPKDKLSFKLNPGAVTMINKPSLFGLIPSKPKPIVIALGNETALINLNADPSNSFRNDSDWLDTPQLENHYADSLINSLNKNVNSINKNTEQTYKIIIPLLIIEWIIVAIISIPMVIPFIFKLGEISERI